MSLLSEFCDGVIGSISGRIDRIFVFLFGAFLKKRVYYGFRQFFFDTPEVTKIVLLKVLQDLRKVAKLYLFCWVTNNTRPEFIFLKFATEWMSKIPKGSTSQLFGFVRLFNISSFIKKSSLQLSDFRHNG